MTNLTDVSETAIFTLRARVAEVEQENPVMRDEMGCKLMGNLRDHLPEEISRRLFKKKIPPPLARHITLRARKYDAFTREFLEKHPNGMVVSLGCGFDTRYWRISNKKWNYVEIDLPELIAVKQEILKEASAYRMIGCSVLDDTWIKMVSAMQKEEVLFLAEGLFMYLHREDVIGVFKKMSEAFSRSQMVFETVTVAYTRGIWKKMLKSKMKRLMGCDAGALYNFGVRRADEVEAFGGNIKVVEEWSYFEDDDIKPGWMKWFRNVRSMTRAQWTVKATVG